MSIFKTLACTLYLLLLISCSASFKNYKPAKKYPKESLQQDFILLKKILEAKHPSLYWYTSKDSMEIFSDKYFNLIRDSLTEREFVWNILAPYINKIHCGHTSVSMSLNYQKWSQEKQLPAFPLFLKIWNDTMVVTGNMDTTNKVLKKGVIVTSINNVPASELINDMISHLSEDGQSHNVSYVRLSSNFPAFHRNIYGLSTSYEIGYIDSSGNSAFMKIPLFVPTKDSSKKENNKKTPKDSTFKINKREDLRSLKIDSSGKYATMRVNTFSSHTLRPFFRKSFRKLKKEKTPNLIIDLRLNGGGDVNTSTLFTKYITRKPFRVADSVYAITQTLAPYRKYFHGGILNDIEMIFISAKHKDERYHLREYEKKLYKPKKRNHFNGKVYILISGPTFSASCLFLNAVKGQKDITILGEESGGGWYGNNGIMIPYITLPNTKARLRIPLFRLIQYNHIDQKGTGVLPDIEIPTSYDAIKNSYDMKMRTTIDRILSHQ